MPSTTTQPLLNASPLQIIEHAFTKVEVRANNPYAENSSANLTCNRSIESSKDSPDIWKVSLEVKIDTIDQAKPTNYTAAIAVTGKFRIRDGYPTEKKRTLMEVTAATILYGCCREMLATVTGRCENGIVSLPSITFASSPDEEKNMAKKTGARKAAKKAKPKVSSDQSS